ncbi:MAG: DeoR/GlpR family DNA-binding transcription regulator [Brevinema sp.]
MKYPQRIQRVLKLLDKHKELSTQDLVQDLGLSPSTVRGLMRQIHEMELANKVHGKLINKNPEALHTKLNFRKVWNIHAKQYIAKKIVDQLKTVHIIYLDESVSALCVAQELKKRRQIKTIVTNSFLIIQEFIDDKEFTVICAGGHLIENAHGFAGRATIQFILDYNIPVAVMGAFGLNSKGTLEVNPLIFELKKTIADNVPRIILAADKFKFDHSGGTLCIPWKNIDIFCTNEFSTDINSLEGFVGQII